MYTYCFVDVFLHIHLNGEYEHFTHSGNWLTFIITSSFAVLDLKYISSIFYVCKSSRRWSINVSFPILHCLRLVYLFATTSFIIYCTFFPSPFLKHYVFEITDPDNGIENLAVCFNTTLLTKIRFLPTV